MAGCTLYLFNCFNYCQHVVDVPMGKVECFTNCGRCFVLAPKSKVCLWKLPPWRGILKWCNVFLPTCRCKHPHHYTHIHTAFLLCPELLLYFTHTHLCTHKRGHTHTISAVVYDPVLQHKCHGDMLTWKGSTNKNTKSNTWLNSHH